VIPEPHGLRVETHPRRGARTRTRRIAAEAAAATIGYSILAILVTRPLFAHLGSAIIGDPASDAGGTVAWLWTLGQEGGFRIFGSTEHQLTGAPIGWEQGNAINVQWLLPYYPAYLVSLGLGEVVAYNLTILSGLVVSSVAMYALVRRLGCTPLVAGWAGLVFMLFPWHLARAEVGHASLTHLEVFPLLFLALHAWTRDRSLRGAALVGLVTCAAWLTSGYWGAMVVIGGIAYAVVVSLFLARSEGVRRAFGSLAYVFLGFAAGTAVVWLLSLPGRTAGGVTIDRTLDDLVMFGARPLEFLLPTADNPVLGDVTRLVGPPTHGSNLSETELYLGWLTIGLALAWLGFAVIRFGRLPVITRATSGGLLAAIVAGLAFAAPSPIEVANSLFFWTPSRMLFSVLPELRVPSRFMALVSSALVPLAALGLQLAYDAVRTRLPSPRTRAAGGVALVVLAGLVSMVEFYPGAMDVQSVEQAPEIYAAVQREPQQILAEYPIDEGSDYKFWQRVHRIPLLNGARIGSEARDVALGVVHPGSPGTAEVLALLGVTTITTWPDALDYTDNVEDRPNAEWGPGYALVQRFEDGASVWRVVARPAPAVATLRRPGFPGPVQPRAGMIPYPLAGANGLMTLRSPAAREVTLSFSIVAPDTNPRTVTIRGADGARDFVVRGERAVRLGVHAPMGKSTLAVSVRPPVDHGLEFTAPRATAGASESVLRAMAASDGPSSWLAVGSR
jgi:hypothetical protein